MRNKKSRRSQRCLLIAGSVLLVLAVGVLFGCQGLPANVANCPITPTAPANTSIVPPAQEPPPAALCGFPIAISSPGNGAIVHSPMPIVATATPPDPIYIVRLYVDGSAVLYTPNTNINELLWMPNGQHTVEMVAEDTAGYVATTSMEVNVVAQDVGATGIQNSKNWVSCSALIAGSTCAAGQGVANPHSPSINPRLRWMDRPQSSVWQDHMPIPTNCTGLRWVGAAMSPTSHTISGSMLITAMRRSPWSLTSTRPSEERVGPGELSAISIKPITGTFGIH